MATIAAIATGIGAATKAAGAVQEGNAAERAGNYNARVLEQNANLVGAQTTEQVRRLRVDSSKQLGNIQANIGASGVAGGSLLDSLQESAATAELDALTLKHQGQMEQRGLRQQAAMERFRGQQAKRAGRFGAASSVLSGAATGASYFGGTS
jgi:hypothetical protein